MQSSDSARGSSLESPIVIAFTLCVVLIKYLVHCSVAVCSVLVSTRKDSASHFLSFSTRLHKIDSCVDCRF